MPAMQSFFSSLIVAAHVISLVNGQDQNVQFNQVVNLNGDVTFSPLLAISSLEANHSSDDTEQIDIPRWFQD